MNEREPLSLNGMMFSVQQKAMRELVGEACYETALASFDRHTQDVVRTTTIGWVPFSLVEAVMTKVAAEAGRAPEALQRDLAKIVGERMLNGVWRLLVRFSSVDAIVARGDVFWSRTYNRGTVRTEEAREGAGTVVVSGVPDASDFMLRGFAYAMETLLSIARARNAQVEWRRTADGAVFRISRRRP